MMKVLAGLLFLAVLGLASPPALPAQENRAIQNSPHARLRPVGPGDVTWTEGFWADRFRQACEVTLPYMWEYFQGHSNEIGLSGIGGSNAWRNFQAAAGDVEAPFSGTNWSDGDFYKWLEAVAWCYGVTGDAKLDELMNKVIDVITRARQPDGYINTQITIPGRSRFVNIQDHETYNLGHLMIAATVHYRVTGKESLLKVAREAADMLYDRFFNTNDHFIGYTSIMGLTELYKTTGDRRYLDLAVWFIDRHGNGGDPNEKVQNRTPLRQETQAVGHAVWGNYLYAGATDVFAQTGDSSLLKALDRIWEDVHTKKQYITGGISAAHRTLTPAGDRAGEAFGGPYELPGLTAMNESCSHTGDAMQSWRLLNVAGKARYADAMERALYNAFLAGIGLEGKSFFYTNPLRRHGPEGPFQDDDTMTRWRHRGGYCCPPNILRTIAKLHTWAYSVTDESVWVNLYGSSELKTRVDDGSEVRIRQQTNYPWDGNVSFTIDTPPSGSFSIMLRIPSWAEGYTVEINGRKVNTETEAGQYVELRQKWQESDVIELELPMRVRLIEANPKIDGLQNKVAVERGPVVYCLESPDLPDSVKLEDVYLPLKGDLTPRYQAHQLKGLTVLEGQAVIVESRRDPWENQLYRETMTGDSYTVPIRLIPYYAWANRGISYMTVWLPAGIQTGK